MSTHLPAPEYQQALGVLATRSDTERALQMLKDSNFPMTQVSVIAKDSELEDEVLANIEVQPQINSAIEKGAATGGAVGTISGLIVGLGTIAIPGIGPVMLAGATATTVMTSVASGVVGAATGGLAGAMIGIGIPEKEAEFYNDLVAQGDYIILIEGQRQEIQNAEKVLTLQGIQEWKVFSKLEHPSVTEVNSQ